MIKDVLKYLEKIPDSNLIQCIGKETTNAIKSYNLVYKKTYNSNYAEILLKKKKKNLFFDKNIFKNIILFLPDNIIKSLATELNIKFDDIEDTRIALCKKKFGYQNEKFSISFLRVLGLDIEFFYPKKVAVETKTSRERISPNYSLHPYQKNLKNRAVEYLLNPEEARRTLIHMPTGAGKTKTAMEILSDYLRTRSVLGGFDQSFSVVWLAHSKELCEQAETAFINTWKLRGDTNLDLFRLYGNSEYSEDLITSNKSIIFSSFQKFYSLMNSNDSLQRSIFSSINQKVKLVIVDEAHKSLARTYHKVIQTLSKALGVQLIGLTATPGRSSDEEDESNKYLAEFYQSNKIGLLDDIGRTVKNPIKYLQDLGVLAKLERRELFSDIQINLSNQEIKELNYYGDSKLGEILSNLAINPARNNLIINQLNSLFSDDKSTLVFACTANHCTILSTLLSEIEIDSAVVLGDTPKKEREQHISDFKSGKIKILINYGVLTTGFDAPNLNAVLIARPTTSLVLYSQMVGRALRGPLNGGNANNILIDIKDNFDLGTESDMFNFYDDFWK